MGDLSPPLVSTTLIGRKLSLTIKSDSNQIIRAIAIAVHIGQVVSSWFAEQTRDHVIDHLVISISVTLPDFKGVVAVGGLVPTK